jgi:serine/threonine protein kinase
MSPNEAGPSTHPQPAPAPHYIDDGHLELVHVIGTGAYGVVWFGVDRRNCVYPHWVPRAVKAIRRTGLDARQKQFQDRELDLHRKASGHPGIVAMDRIVTEGDNTYVVMEFGNEGDLFGMICDRKRVSLSTSTVSDLY